MARDQAGTALPYRDLVGSIVQLTEVHVTAPRCAKSNLCMACMTVDGALHSNPQTGFFDPFGQYFILNICMLRRRSC